MICISSAFPQTLLLSTVMGISCAKHRQQRWALLSHLCAIPTPGHEGLIALLLKEPVPTLGRLVLPGVEVSEVRGKLPCPWGLQRSRESGLVCWVQAVTGVHVAQSHLGFSPKSLPGNNVIKMGQHRAFPPQPVYLGNLSWLHP